MGDRNTGYYNASQESVSSIALLDRITNERRILSTIVTHTQSQDPPDEPAVLQVLPLNEVIISLLQKTNSPSCRFYLPRLRAVIYRVRP